MIYALGIILSILIGVAIDKQVDKKLNKKEQENIKKIEEKLAYNEYLQQELKRR